MANYYYQDSCKALWRFEPGALLVDSIGGNTLAQSNGSQDVTVDTSNYWEGAGSALFTRSLNNGLTIPNANLDSGFPLKSGDAVKKGSFCFFYKPTAIYSDAFIFSIGWGSNNGMVFCPTGGGAKAYIAWGYGSGVQWLDLAAVMVAGKLYYCALVIDGENKTCKVNIYNITDGLVFHDSTFTPTNTLSLGTTPFNIGNFNGLGYCCDGRIDGFVVFNRLLSDAEISSLRLGTFGENALLYGQGINQLQSDASARVLFYLKGQSTIITQSEAKAGIGFRSFGESITQAVGDSRLGIFGILKGESASIGISDSFLGITIDVVLMSDPNLIVKFKPYVGGGGVLTYKAGSPDVATFWDIVGVSPTGFTEPSHGSLRWHYIKSDKSGLAANIYVCPKDPVTAGHRDRIIVRKANA